MKTSRGILAALVGLAAFSMSCGYPGLAPAHRASSYGSADLNVKRQSYMKHVRQRTVFIAITCKTKGTKTHKSRTVRGHGSGVILKSVKTSSYILTARHIVSASFKMSCTFTVFSSDDLEKKKGYVATVVAMGSKTGKKVNDTALLRVSTSLGVSSKLATTSYIGQRVVSVGFPALKIKGALNTVSITEGVLATKYFKNSSLGLIRVTSPFFFGNSGGPIFNARGEVVGIISYMSAGRTIFGHLIPISGMFYAVSYEAVSYFLRSSGNTGLLH